MKLTQEYLKSLFEYKDGFLYWKVKKSFVTKIGSKAGYLKSDKLCPKYKRIVIEIDNKNYYASRLIFLYHHGWLPEIVDHHDRNEENDRIDNLRAADTFKNSRNRTSSIGSASKYLGVTKNKGKWVARIGHNKIRRFLGVFDLEDDAAIAYNIAAKTLHGEFANLNIIQ